jgi:NAD(P)-dependent dehydrogenase (short-subunit alcohol dehydrogenase family)
MSAASQRAPRRAFVTGAAKGIGAAIARRLAANGADVVLADRDVAGAETVATSIGGRAVGLDVTDFARVRAVVAETGPFDILVNNAGIDQHAFFTDTPEAEWRRLLEVNLVAVLAVVHAVLPRMQAAKFGRVVNIVSEAARLGSKGGAVYAAAKGGVISFTRSIARENARYGITANCVAPGPIDTPMLRTGMAQIGERHLGVVIDATQLKRLGTPEEVAAAVAFLASDEASYITGETLGVSGGMGLGAG